MTVGLFVPCYIDQFYPRVAIAALDLLEKYGCQVEVPEGQTCCGQPLANAGYEASTHDVARRFVDLFEKYDYVVSPSASCTLHVVDHYEHFQESLPDTEQSRIADVRNKTYELCQFLSNILNVEKVDAEFNHRVGIHPGCHGLRGLRLAGSTELMESRPDIVRQLLSSVKGLELVSLNRPDECCGFGGTFSVGEESVSVKMGTDRLRDFESSGADVVTSTDMSCLMHLQGLASRRSSAVQIVHVAEILNGSVA